MYKGTWIKYNNKYYYAASNGVLPVSGWRRIRCDGKMYYFCFSNCAALTNRSATRAGTKGWLDSRGRFTTGWVTIDSSRNLARYINPATGKWYRNTSAWIDGVNYRFNKYGNRVYDRTSEFKRNRYYLECDRTNGVMTVYTDSSKKYPIKTIRVSVGNPTSLTTSRNLHTDKISSLAAADGTILGTVWYSCSKWNLCSFRSKWSDEWK